MQYRIWVSGRLGSHRCTDRSQAAGPCSRSTSLGERAPTASRRPAGPIEIRRCHKQKGVIEGLRVPRLPDPPPARALSMATWRLASETRAAVRRTSSQQSMGLDPVPEHATSSPDLGTEGGASPPLTESGFSSLDHTGAGWGRPCILTPGWKLAGHRAPVAPCALAQKNQFIAQLPEWMLMGEPGMPAWPSGPRPSGTHPPAHERCLPGEWWRPAKSCDCPSFLAPVKLGLPIQSDSHLQRAPYTAHVAP